MHGAPTAQLHVDDALRLILGPPEEESLLARGFKGPHAMISCTS